LVAGFDPKAFDRFLKRDDVTWSLQELARRSGVTAHAIRCWRRGRYRPNKIEWRCVAAVLALEPCGHCGGSGMVDPSGPERITALVTRPSAPPPLWSIERLHRAAPAIQDIRIVRPDPTPLTGSVRFACGLTFEPQMLRLVGPGVEVRLSPGDVELLTMLAGNRYTSSAVIAARLGVSDQGARIRWHRVRDRLRGAGIDPATVVEVRATGGYRLLLADAPAVEGVG
jgi:hypothetical protein